MIVLLGISLLYSCKKEEKDPVLDMNLTVKSQLTTPQDGTSYVLLQDEADSVFAVFNWSPAVYNLTNLENTKYILQMDTAGSNFAGAVNLITTTGTTYEITVGAMNQKLLAMGFLPDVATNLIFRVFSYINDDTPYSDAYSDVITLAVTPYSTFVYVKPIYMLGSATDAGWDNTKALEMTHLEGGSFAIVAHLVPGADKYVKFISILGAWAPQWGTDATGTGEAGPLVYRPDEGTPDPPAIPAPDTEGDFRIVADTFNLTYTITATSAQLYLVGDATNAGWNAGDAIEFTKVAPGQFTITTALKNTGGMKFLEVQGAWAPQWGTDDTGTGEFGPLVYRPDEATPDPPQIPAPSSDGTYTIDVDLLLLTYTIKKQ